MITSWSVWWKNSNCFLKFFESKSRLIIFLKKRKLWFHKLVNCWSYLTFHIQTLLLIFLMQRDRMTWHCAILYRISEKKIEPKHSLLQFLRGSTFYIQDDRMCHLNRSSFQAWKYVNRSEKLSEIYG